MNTPKFRVSWPKVFAPEKNELSGKMEYSVTALFPKDTDLSALKAEAQKALVDKFKDQMNDKEFVAKLRNPFRKNKEKWKTVEGKQVIPAGYEDPDAIWITMKTTQKPEVVDQNVQSIINQADFYAGCWAVASYSVFAYDQKGNRGVSIGLTNIQKVAEGEPLSGRPKAESQFAAVAPAAGSTTGAGSVFD